MINTLETQLLNLVILIKFRTKLFHGQRPFQ